MNMEKMVYKAIIRYLKKHYPSELDKIVKRAKEIMPDLKAKAPDIGGRENTLANNMDMKSLCHTCALWIIPMRKSCTQN